MIKKNNFWKTQKNKKKQKNLEAIFLLSYKSFNVITLFWRRTKKQNFLLVQLGSNIFLFDSASCYFKKKFVFLTWIPKEMISTLLEALWESPKFDSLFFCKRRKRTRKKKKKKKMTKNKKQTQLLNERENNNETNLLNYSR